VSAENKHRLIVLSNQINKDSSKFVIEEVLRINKEDDDKDKIQRDFKREPIDLVVNSFGGSIYDGLAIVSVIDSSKTPVHTYVYGYAMSMGLLIAVAGHKRFGTKLATFMYHEASSRPDGKIEELKESVEQHSRMMGVYDNYLLSKTNIIRKDIDEIKHCQKNWYIPADEALKLKIIDEIF
jgi:ATP-dependent Clp protease protease subunit